VVISNWPVPEANLFDDEAQAFQDGWFDVNSTPPLKGFGPRMNTNEHE
jgi:hypothetical protein